jgi:STE24 endopeptidase
MIYFIAAALVFSALLRSYVDYLNLRQAQAGRIPEEFAGLLDPEKFKKAQEYLVAQTKFALFSRAAWLVVGLVFLLGGGYSALDQWARGFELGAISTALIYFAALGALSEIFSLPFSWVNSFRLEARFGFNRTTVATFVADHIKGWILGCLLGGGILAGILWFFDRMGDKAWLFAWAFLALVQIVLSFVAPVLLMPLFNKFSPLAEGDLKKAIESYAASQGMRLKGIFTMDGSKRSAKANAFFTGFGSFRRIVLFDTLVEKHPIPELVAVLAHEVGHMKRGHIKKGMALSLVVSFVMFWALFLALKSEPLQLAFGFQALSLQAGFTAAILLYEPFGLFMGIITGAISRKHEFEADAFAAETADANALASALKRLSADNLSNLFPHPWKVKLEYSHPPVLERVRALMK